MTRNIYNIPKAKARGMVKIDHEFCKGCELCLSVCPTQALYISEKSNSQGIHYAAFDNDKPCIACKFCALICPDCAIEVYREERDQDHEP